MLLIAIDGACRRNGKPDCVAAGGVFVQMYGEDHTLLLTETASVHEVGSTSQRGEVLALLKALDYAWTAKQDANIITDSEYLFNAMTKQWFENWVAKGWVTAVGEPVKNRDLWEEVMWAYRKCDNAGIELAFYHIKGHVIPFGKVTASRELALDPTGKSLLHSVRVKYDAIAPSKQDKLEYAQRLSMSNNGFHFSEDQLRDFVSANLVADAVATESVEAADKALITTGFSRT